MAGSLDEGRSRGAKLTSSTKELEGIMTVSMSNEGNERRWKK